jgi:hypothetical protein
LIVSWSTKTVFLTVRRSQVSWSMEASRTMLQKRRSRIHAYSFFISLSLSVASRYRSCQPASIMPVASTFFFVAIRRHLPFSAFCPELGLGLGLGLCLLSTITMNVIEIYYYLLLLLLLLKSLSLLISYTKYYILYYMSS